MSVAKTIELTADSEKSFEDAVSVGVRKAAQTLEGVKAAWVANQEVLVEGGEIRKYRVHLRVTFVLGD